MADLIGVPHLRVNLAVPGQPWSMQRFCDGICLIEWLEDELDPDTPARVFIRSEWVDSKDVR